MDNHGYNLMKAISKRACGLSKYDKYIEDSANCEACQNLWRKLKEEDAKDLEEMKNVLFSHVKDGTIK